MLQREHWASLKASQTLSKEAWGPFKPEVFEYVFANCQWKMDNVFVLAVDPALFLEHLASQIKQNSMCVFILVNFDKFAAFLDPKTLASFRKLVQESSSIVVTR